ncbi:MAG TPA: tRNA pseudouridine(55) synthase TruB [Gemmatimonadaceae bacterium]|nr:tRNA pseudouridine(55) synthase TruB [Gemmatimonadaceae bacterium]
MTQTATRPTNGFVLIDKPEGATSHDVVRQVRRVLGAPAGHTGTLDPFASGLLVILAGSATRLARFVPSDPKVYEATIRFGVATDTDDRTGSPVAWAPLPRESAVRAAAARLTGRISQVPPAFSAKHVAGARAYALARSGKEVQLRPVEVEVYYWNFLEREGDTWLARVSCSTGTYVRALARDLGQLAGSAAHLVALRRIRIGPFTLDDATTLAEFLEAPRLQPVAAALPGWPSQTLAPEEATRVRHGARVVATVPGRLALLLDPSGELLALAERRDDHWQPRVVLGSR